MRVLDTQLKYLPVVTRDGQYRGRIIHWSIDDQTQAVLEYTIATFPYILSMGREEIIPRSMVVSISAERMVVEDARIPITEGVPVSPLAVE